MFPTTHQPKRLHTATGPVMSPVGVRIDAWADAIARLQRDGSVG